MRESYLVIDFKKVIKPVIDEERKQTEEIKKIKSK